MPREKSLPLICAGVLACGLTFTLVKLLDRLRRKDAESEAQEIVRRAQQEVENRRREAELEIKESTIQAQAESEKELRKLRGELHERERLLDKRQDALEEQAEQVRKQEKIVEGTPAQADRADPGRQPPQGGTLQALGLAAADPARA